VARDAGLVGRSEETRIITGVRDAIVVGGGPGGLYAASKLAAAGFSVALLEEHEASGEPVHCTGVLAATAFDEFGLDVDAVLNQLRTVRFYSPCGETVEYSTPDVEAVVIDRGDFDRRLAATAARAGVQLWFGDRVTGIEVGSSGVAVSIGGTVRRARACILACGAAYAAQRKLRLGVPRLLLHSAQAELPASRPGDVEVHFGARVAPGGFGWAVPVLRDRPSVRIGVMCERHADRYFNQMLGRLAARWGIRSPAACRPRQKILPLGPIRRTFADRVLVVGDAAGLVKPTTGGGIYYSLLSARLAADTLIAALGRDDLSAESLREYQIEWRKRIGSELRWQLVLRRIAQRLTDDEIEGLFGLARTDGLMPLLRRTATFNQHRDFIVALLKHPPARRVLFRAALA
jgi:digeranylgeranylglycerophospholipid reductase